MVLPYVIIEHFYFGSNANTPFFILSGYLIFFLTNVISPQGIAIGYPIACFLVKKIEKDYLRLLILISLSLAWLVIQTFVVAGFVVPIL
ncbi:MAG: hypothetical protein ABH867_02790 [Patescibacteria group bacterium]